MRKIIFFLFCCGLFSLTAAFCHSATIEVSSYAKLKTALRVLEPGDSVYIQPGIYNRGISFKNLHGTVAAPIVISGSDPNNPPIFKGRGEGLKVSQGSYLKFANLVFRGFSANGINIDDGGNFNTPSHHIIFDNIKILEIGPKGNRDALKLSGVKDFIIRNSSIEGWGGSAVDMVGCWNGVVENSQFVGKEGFRQGNGIQMKGGTHSILLQNNLFRQAGSRMVQIGGSTGKQYFRPAVTDFEAKNITVAGNTFIGGEAQISWVTAQDSHIHHNLFYLPEKWLGRILQETKDPQFKRSQRGFFENNLVVTDERVKMFINVGKGTAPETFVFQKNLWFRPGGDNKPNLPTFEKDGIYAVDPMILEQSDGSIKINSADPLVLSVGPQAYTALEYKKDFSDVETPKVMIPTQEFSLWDHVKALVD